MSKEQTWKALREPIINLLEPCFACVHCDDNSIPFDDAICDKCATGWSDGQIPSEYEWDQKTK